VTDQKHGFTDFIKDVKEAKAKQLENNARATQSLELLNNLIKEYGMPTDKYRGVLQTAFDVIGHFNEVTLGMSEEILLKNREINGGRKLIEYVEEKITNQDQSNIELNYQVNTLKEAVKKTDERLSKAKISTQRRFEHTLNIAIEVATDYSINHPKRLGPQNCEYGVKAELDRMIFEIMREPEEYRKSNLSQPPSTKTIEKRRNEALKALGFIS
jgi:hypothetical protein